MRAVPAKGRRTKLIDPVSVGHELDSVGKSSSSSVDWHMFRSLKRHFFLLESKVCMILDVTAPNRYGGGNKSGAGVLNQEAAPQKKWPLQSTPQIPLYALDGFKRLGRVFSA